MFDATAPAPVPTPDPPKRKRINKHWLLYPLVALIALGIGGSMSGQASPATSATPATTVTKTTTETGDAPAPETSTVTATETETTEPAPPSGIEEGTYEVGNEIKPGKYKSTGNDDGCYWARLSSSSEQDIIDNHVGAGPTTVVIKRTDKYFTTNGCHPFVKAG